MSDAADAYTYLLNAVAPSDAVVVTGSLYLVGELRSALRHTRSQVSRTVGMTA
jgi:folylpolyglutamate synthase/dihydropteroate synthase